MFMPLKKVAIEMKPQVDTIGEWAFSTGELVLLVVGVLLTLAVCGYLLVFFIIQQVRERRGDE